jgi:hypothetical protein
MVHCLTDNSHSAAQEMPLPLFKLKRTLPCSHDPINGRYPAQMFIPSHLSF